MSQSDSQFDQLIVLVHGVGDPEPGESLACFSRAVAAESEPLAEQGKVLWLNEKGADSAHVQTFPAHERNLQANGRRIKLAEVFWGDLSRVMQGVPGIVFGLFQILFGLRYVAYVAADQSGRAAKWLKHLGLISSRMLHGPVLAVTCFLGILSVAVSGTQVLWTNSYQGSFWTRCVITACTAFGLATCVVSFRLTRNRVIERFGFWLGVTSLFMFGLMVVKALAINDANPDLVFADDPRPGLIWYCRVLVVLLGFLWLSEILIVIGMAACWLAAIAKPKANRPALHIAFLLPALSIGVWGLAIPIAWLSARQSAARFLKLKDFAGIFEEAVPLLGVQFVMCVAVMIAAALLATCYLNWRRRHSVQNYLDGARPPRLIVHPGMQLTLAACTAVGSALLLTVGTVEALGFTHQEFWFGRLMVESNKYAVAVLVPLVVLLAFALPRLQPVFDIVLDVVNHFHFRATNLQDALDDDDEFDIDETTFESGNLFFSRRQAVHSRMHRVLKHYRDHISHRPELVIVAHSQGTQIAIEVLNDPELAWINNHFRSVKLVTMGSPFSNLYQHYFSHLYPALDQPYWASLRTRVDRWTNVFRIDDPVGTEIAFKPLQRLQQRLNQHATCDSHSTCLELKRPMQVSNHPVGCRGHVHYWTDREVLDVIHETIFEADSETAGDSSARAA